MRLPVRTEQPWQGKGLGNPIAPLLTVPAVPIALGKFFDAAAFFEHGDPLVHTGVRIGFATKNENW